MTKSEEYEQLAAQEENDIRAMAYEIKANRERRFEKFKHYHLKKIADKFQYEIDIVMCRYTIYGTGFGTIDFYPKADKVIIRVNRKNPKEKNKCINHGLKFILKYILNEIDSGNNNVKK